MLPRLSASSFSDGDNFNHAAGKRRRIRKGTFSCWECKRRKIRCQLPSASSSVCLNCQRFEVPCIRQDVEEPVENSHNENEERLIRIEALVNELQKQRSGLQWKDNRPTQPPRPFEFDVEELPRDFTIGTSANVPRASREVLSNRLIGSVISRTVTENITSRCRSLYDYLQTFVPPPSTAALIVTHGQSPFAVLEQPSKVVAGFTTDVSGSQNRHLLGLAQGLLHLALCLQRLNVKSIQPPGIRLEAPNAIMARRYVDAARQVTSQDSLLASYEGLDTLMLESSFETSAGNFQAAWLNIRRAINIAQLIYPHKSVSELPGREQLIWSRLVLFDRVLSLMLGLAFDAGTNKRSIIAKEGSISLERRHAAICERIISRNLRMQERLHHRCELNDAYDDFEETRNIDDELKRAMRSMSLDRWNPPRIPTTATETATFADQLHHYDLLVLTHLPYLIHGSHRHSSIDPNESRTWNVQHEYNRFAALSASREVLRRVLLCCRSRHVSCSTSGLVHKAFHSSLCLLLAHVEGHTLGRGNVLEHQRPADLIMVTNIIDHMEEITRLSEGSPYFNSEALRQLVKVEQDAADGNTYVTLTATDCQELGYIGAGGENINLEFSLPYLGTIRVERQLAERNPPVDQSTWLNCWIDDNLAVDTMSLPGLGIDVNGE